MQEIFSQLTDRDRVLDLGCAQGSFPREACPGFVVRADMETPASPGGEAFVACQAERLPFADQSFRAVICNHSVEHFARLDAALTEIGRVLEPEGYLYVSVPDAGVLSDRLYRWVGRGGGHVNAFYSSEDVVRRFRSQTKLELRGVRMLYSSLSFLNRRNIRGRRQLKVWLLGGGSETLLRFASLAFRLADRWLGSRTAIYGWAFFFGGEVQVEPDPWANVCVRCGSGHAPGSLQLRRTWFGPLSYACPRCSTRNYYIADQEGFRVR